MRNKNRFMTARSQASAAKQMRTRPLSTGNVGKEFSTTQESSVFDLLIFSGSHNTIVDTGQLDNLSTNR